MWGFRRVAMSGLLLASSVVLTGSVLAQTPGKAELSFEVASVKPAPPLNPMEIIQTGKIPRVGMTVEGTRVDIGYLSLADLIRIAYAVKPFQVDGPDWLKSERFNIQARMPEGSTKEQAPVMLQALLAERFQLKVHRENREHSVYALVVAKGGHKLKESPPDAEPAPAGPPPDSPIGFGNAAFGFGNGSQVRVDPTGGGATITTSQNGTIRYARSPDGQLRVESSKVTMAELAGFLGQLVDRPVADATELRGPYQIALDLAPVDLLNMVRASGIGSLLPANLPVNLAPAGQAADPSSNSVFTSVQQLGLRLDSRKAPAEFIIVDQVEKAPTDN
jgi:uncharacterized protein (TIGR03435 family)